MKKATLIRLFAAFAVIVVVAMISGSFEAGVGFMAVAAVVPSLMKTSKELMEERATKMDEISGILEKGKEEKRDLNADEGVKYEKLMNEVRELDGKIEATREMEELATKRAANKIAQSNQKKEETQKNNYSIIKAIRGFSAGKLDGYEAEMDQEARMQHGKCGVSYGPGSLVVPFVELSQRSREEKRDMTVGTPTAGGNAVATELKDWIDYLYNRMVLPGLGADFMTGLVGNIAFPRATAIPTATWEGETDANAESNPTVDQVTMSPKRVGTYVDISKMLLLQTSPSIDARIKNQLMTSMGLGIEYAAIHGPGSGGSPTGIAATSGIGSVALGTDGDVMTWNGLVGLETEVSQDNADAGRLAYLTNSKVRGLLKRTLLDAGSGQFLWNVNANQVNGYNVAITNQVSSALTKGSGTALSAMFFGNWSDLVIGQWGGMEIVVDNLTLATTGLIRLVINIYADVAVLHAQSFSACLDIKTS